MSSERRVDGDTKQYGLEPPFRHWEADSTGMVHVLWSAQHGGLTLEKDCDEIARMIMGSRWLRAVRAEALADVPADIRESLGLVAIDPHPNASPTHHPARTHPTEEPSA